MTLSLTVTTVCLLLSLLIASVSSLSLTMMASKYLGKSPVFVAGGSQGVGYEIVKQLTQLGTPVHALVRREVSGIQVVENSFAYMLQVFV